MTTDRLTKYYKRYAAVQDVSLHVRKNDVYALIGRNGAGKTTILKMLSRLSLPTEGTVSYYEDMEKAGIGVLIEDPGLFPNLTAFQNLEIKERALGLKDPGKLKELLDIVGLANWAHVKTRSFSLGMKKRLGMALALVGDPELLILDEPMSGLDPQGIAELRGVIRHLHEAGKTIIVSSHMLEELSKTATVYAVLENGHLREEKTEDELKVNLLSHLRIVCSPIEEAKAVLEQHEIFSYQTKGEDTILLMEKMDSADEILMMLVSAGIRVSECRPVYDSIEDYFIGLTGEDRA